MVFMPFQRYAIEMSVKITETYESKLKQGLIRPSAVAVSIVVTDSSIGALKGHYKKGLPDPEVYVGAPRGLLHAGRSTDGGRSTPGIPHGSLHGRVLHGRVLHGRVLHGAGVADRFLY